MGRRGEIALNPRADPGCLPSLSGTGNQLRLNTQTLTIYFFLSLFFKIFIYLAVAGLSCSMWDLVPRPGVEPGPPALETQSLDHWTSKEVQPSPQFFIV